MLALFVRACFTKSTHAIAKKLFFQATTTEQACTRKLVDQDTYALTRKHGVREISSARTNYCVVGGCRRWRQSFDSTQVFEGLSMPQGAPALRRVGPGSSGRRHTIASSLPEGFAFAVLDIAYLPSEETSTCWTSAV